MSVAELGYKIDSSGAVVAAGDLDKMTAAAIKAERGANGVGVASQAAGKKGFFAGSGFRNMALQLNQVGQQTAASGDLLRSFTIQLPDLLLGFGTLGIAAGALAPLMVGLGASFLGAGGDAKDFEDAIGQVEDKLSQYSDLVASKNEGAGDMFKQAEAAIRGASDAYSDLIAIAKIDAMGSIGTALDELSDSVMGYSYLLGAVGDSGNLLDIETQLQGNITEWKNNRAEVAAFNDELKALAGAATLDEQYEAAQRVKDAFTQNVDVTGEMTERQIEFWKSLNQSIFQMELLGASIEVATSAGRANIEAIAGAAIDQSQAASDIIDKYNQQAALSSVIAQYGKDSVQYEAAKRDAAMGAAEQYIRQNDLSGMVAQSVRDAAASAWDAEAGAIAASNALASAERNAVALANAIAAAAGFSANLEGGVKVLEAEISALHSGADAAIARTTTAMKVQADAQRQKQLAAGVDSVIANSQYAIDIAAIERQKELLDQRKQLQSTSTAASGSGQSPRSGGSGGGVADTYQRDIDALIESLRTERETVDAWYAESDALLNDRRTMELLGVEGHNEAKLRLEAEYQERLAGIQEMGAQNSVTTALDGASDMFGALGAISDKALKAQAITAAGSAWISTLVGAAKELEKGTFGFKTALAVISKGAGFVAAIKAAGSGGSSGGGGGTSAPSAGTATSPTPQQRAIIQVSGGRSRFTIDEMNDIIAGLQNKSKNGVIIEGFTRA